LETNRPPRDAGESALVYGEQLQLKSVVVIARRIERGFAQVASDGLSQSGSDAMIKDRGSRGTPMVDGARNSLLGYLYQLLRTASLVTLDRVEHLNCESASLLARVAVGTVCVEEFQQDTVIRPNATPKEGLTAIQYKHSGVHDNDVELPEFLEILNGFHNSRVLAEKGSEKIDHFALVTNRSLSSALKEIVASKTNAEPHAQLFQAPKKGKANAALRKRLEPHGGDPSRAAEAWHSILGGLDVIDSQSFEEGVTRLHTFASRYGVLEHEWPDRLSALVGAMVNETATGAKVMVSREWLKGHLVGDPLAANLHFGRAEEPHIRTRCHEYLEQRVAIQHGDIQHLCVTRRVSEQIARALETASVVFVVGKGGRGKSLAVANYLRSIAHSHLVSSHGAVTACEDELVKEITRLRLPKSVHLCPDRSLDDVWRRLTTANDSSRPLWAIDIDGVDEAPDQTRNVRRVINLCWAQGNRELAPASLLVSYRPKRDIWGRNDLVSEWFSTAQPDLVEGIGYVEVGDFTIQELDELADLLGGEPERRIHPTTLAESGPSLRPVRKDILTLLRHPVVWGVYAGMIEAERSAVLDGEVPLLNRLVRRLCERFRRRCHTRRSWEDGAMLQQALVAISQTTVRPDVARPYGREHWDQASDMWLDRSASTALFSECLSYGLVESHAQRKWQWCHRIVAEYLAHSASEVWE
jgi:hypothetical protein